MEEEFTPWGTPLMARVFRGFELVGDVLTFAPDVDACRTCSTLALEMFYGFSKEMRDAS